MSWQALGIYTFRKGHTTIALIHNTTGDKSLHIWHYWQFWLPSKFHNTVAEVACGYTTYGSPGIGAERIAFLHMLCLGGHLR